MMEQLNIPYGEDRLRYMHVKALERIREQHPDRAKRAFEALAWVVYGARLLKLEEL